MLAQTALEGFTEINRQVLESALAYLSCPLDKQELIINTENKETISDGEFCCTTCGATYPIVNGVPYFFEGGNGYEWDICASPESIIQCITAEREDKPRTWKKVISLSSLLQRRFKSAKKSIDALFEIVSSVPADTETQAFLMQAATAARYDLENYRGTFTLAPQVISALQQQQDSGIIVEGACATGENLLASASSIDSPFYMGLDISGAMVRTAQQQARGKMLFVQGNICLLPIKKNAAGIYILNNVFDRVVDPLQACREADGILRTNGTFVLSNCEPLQFTYQTADGRTVLFVSKEKQLSLEQGLALAGFQKKGENQGVWNVQTTAYGRETLPYKTIWGVRT